MIGKENEYTRLAVRMEDDILVSHLNEFEKYQEALLQAVVWEVEKRGLTISIPEGARQAIELFRKQQEEEETEAKRKEALASTQQEGTEVLPETRPLFSRSAILGFSLFFSPISGGILLALNIHRLEKKGIFQVILFAIIFTAFQGFVSMQVQPGSLLVILVNVAGALFMSELMWNQFIGKKQAYQKRSIVIPLLIALAIVAPLAWYLMQHPELMEQLQATNNE